LAECHAAIADTKDTVQAILDEFTSTKSEVSLVSHGLREVQVNKASITSYQAGMDDVNEMMDRLEAEIEHMKRAAKVNAPRELLTNINGWEETEIEARLELLKGVVTDHVINLHTSLGKTEDDFNSKLHHVQKEMQVIEGTQAMHTLRHIFAPFTTSGDLIQKVAVWKSKSDQASHEKDLIRIAENKERISHNSLRLAYLEASVPLGIPVGTEGIGMPVPLSISHLHSSADTSKLEDDIAAMSAQLKGVTHKLATYESENSALGERLFGIESGMVREKVALQTKLNKYGEDIDSFKQEMRRQPRGLSPDGGQSSPSLQGGNAEDMALQLQEFWATEQEALRKEVNRDLTQLKDGLVKLAAKTDERATTLTEGLVRHERKNVRRIDSAEEAFRKVSEGAKKRKQVQGIAKVRRAFLRVQAGHLATCFSVFYRNAIGGAVAKAPAEVESAAPEPVLPPVDLRFEYEYQKLAEKVQELSMQVEDAAKTSEGDTKHIELSNRLNDIEAFTSLVVKRVENCEMKPNQLQPQPVVDGIQKQLAALELAVNSEVPQIKLIINDMLHFDGQLGQLQNKVDKLEARKHVTTVATRLVKKPESPVSIKRKSIKAWRGHTKGSREEIKSNNTGAMWCLLRNQRLGVRGWRATAKASLMSKLSRRKGVASAEQIHVEAALQTWRHFSGKHERYRQIMRRAIRKMLDTSSVNAPSYNQLRLSGNTLDVRMGSLMLEWLLHEQRQVKTLRMWLEGVRVIQAQQKVVMRAYIRWMDGQVHGAFGTWRDVSEKAIHDLTAIRKAVKAITMRSVNKAYESWHHVVAVERERRQVLTRAMGSWNAVLQAKMFRAWLDVSNRLRDEEQKLALALGVFTGQKLSLGLDRWRGVTADLGEFRILCRRMLAGFFHIRLLHGWNKWRNEADELAIDATRMCSSTSRWVGKGQTAAFGLWREEALIRQQQIRILGGFWRRMQNRLLLCSWNSWFELSTSYRRDKQLLRRAIHRLKQSIRAKLLLRWRAFCTNHRWVRAVASKWIRLGKAKAWRSWRAVFVRDIRRRQPKQASMFGERAMLRSWRQKTRRAGRAELGAARLLTKRLGRRECNAVAQQRVFSIWRRLPARMIVSEETCGLFDGSRCREETRMSSHDSERLSILEERVTWVHEQVAGCASGLVSLAEQVEKSELQQSISSLKISEEMEEMQTLVGSNHESCARLGVDLTETRAMMQTQVDTVSPRESKQEVDRWEQDSRGSETHGRTAAWLLGESSTGCEVPVMGNSNWWLGGSIRKSG